MNHERTVIDVYIHIHIHTLTYIQIYISNGIYYDILRNIEAKSIYMNHKGRLYCYRRKRTTEIWRPP